MMMMMMLELNVHSRVSQLERQEQNKLTGLEREILTYYKGNGKVVFTKRFVDVLQA